MCNFLKKFIRKTFILLYSNMITKATSRKHECVKVRLESYLLMFRVNLHAAVIQACVVTSKCISEDFVMTCLTCKEKFYYTWRITCHQYQDILT